MPFSSIMRLLLAGAVLLAPFAGSVGAKAAEKAETVRTAAELSGKITLAGSTAMQPLVEEAAKRFMAKHPKVQITVQGGGSGTGLSQVAQGSVDIGNSDLYAEEKLKPEQAKDLVDHQVAVVAMAAVAHPDVGVDNLTKKQLIDIFTGKITNWKDVGGKNQKIVLVNRPASSGTRATFKKYALDGAEEASGIEEDSSGTVRKIVAETPGAIGYLALSYLDGSVKALKIDGVAPTKENVVTNRYKVWAYQHMYTKGKPTGVVAAFLDFMLNDPEVQGPSGLVVKSGYIPTTDMHVMRDHAGNVKKIVVFQVGSQTYTVGGERYSMETAPFVDQNRTFVPISFAATALGVPKNNIVWDPKAKTVTITKGNQKVVIKIDARTMSVNGVNRPLDAPAKIVKGRTMVPIAQVAEALDVEYKWVPETKSVRFW
ncbi:MAG: phosphate ABC transporter substrate-binding protein PstS family protein [Hydrogenibacillus schlegelii]|uniref:Phosphate-binding protein n=1 Tax=Hydrogenibacillus schlegelii TaxID=1484 RepID=A0A947CVY3_HYDSH|nr:phosphate ABC transporter substrate-binding protein PstS family protein [Hydrogenibacillus schlegelii]